jgi:hypothetical protein
MFNERNKFRSNPLAPLSPGLYLRYAVQGSNLKFIPIPSIGNSIEVYYIPQPLKLVIAAPAAGESLTFDAINGWDEWVICDLAAKMLMKQERDSSGLVGLREAAKNRILTMAPARDAGMPERVVDVSRMNDSFTMPWLGL